LRRWRQHPPSAASDSESDADSHADADADSHTNSHTDSDSHSHPDTNPHADADAFGLQHGGIPVVDLLGRCRCNRGL
jgi:hypothetical protein